MLAKCLPVLFFLPAGAQQAAPGQPVYTDIPYVQKYAVKFGVPGTGNAVVPEMQALVCDRNGMMQVLTSQGLLTPSGGTLLYPGKLIQDRRYLPLLDRKIRAVTNSGGRIIYLDDQYLFSNAQAGNLLVRHSLPGANLMAAGPDGSFLISDGRKLQFIDSSKKIHAVSAQDSVIALLYDAGHNCFRVLGAHSLSSVAIPSLSATITVKADNLTCFALTASGDSLITGTHDGYFTLPAASGAGQPQMKRHLPAGDLTAVSLIDGKTWFGSTAGAFMLRDDGKFDYYASKRWLLSDSVAGLTAGPDHSVFILTTAGLTEIHSDSTTLAGKARFFEKQVRSRHLRNGFNSTLSRMNDGNPDTGSLEDSDNDGLWTSMYLGGEVFRYVVTRDPEVLENIRESMDAMERLYSITGLKGFPARSFERSGYESADKKVWRTAADLGWDWKSTTSSDEAIGHIFVFGTIAELLDDSALQRRAIALIDRLMQHIVDHKLYMIDWDGKPTRWGRWNPEYVNVRPVMVGDRKITSSNIVAMLQTAYHFTHKKIYKDKITELIRKYGYLDNLMRPMNSISSAPAGADELSRDLSDAWNHSDDEMYFLGYWGLYRYALTDSLKARYKTAIVDHWQAERPEKEAAWDIATAMTGVGEFDLGNAVWYLQRYPMDLVNWTVDNNNRHDIQRIDSNFRRQLTTEVLPPDELPISRHNANRFDLEGGDNGSSENSAGDIWLLPYWMGRYLGVISAPAGNFK